MGMILEFCGVLSLNFVVGNRISGIKTRTPRYGYLRMHHKMDLNTYTGRPFVSNYNIPIKRSPEKGTRSWCEEGAKLIRTKCEGSGGPLSIR